MDKVDTEASDEKLEWGNHINLADKDSNKEPSGSYNAVSEALRQNFPHEATCSMFCGGKKCKYCCVDNWKADEQAITGLYSHWVTENILAMSRPVTEYVEKFNVIEQFKSVGISAIINTQLPGEHASCGNGNHDNEFSYQQQTFMDNGVFFYNFGWPDFGVADSMSSLLDMVKVMQFTLSQGKLAVHCHAGKGRTGVLIACFLVFHNRMTANEAVYYVRSRRPNSVQTTPQVKCVQQFESFLKPLRVVFPSQAGASSFNLTQYLLRQRLILHGFQARTLKNIPKIIQKVCEALLKIAKNGKVTKEVEHIGHALTTEKVTADVRTAVDKHKERLNDSDSAWNDVRAETNPFVLSKLLWEWLDELKDPILRRQDFRYIFENIDEPERVLNCLEKGVQCTLTYLMEFIAQLQPITEELEFEIIYTLLKGLTHQSSLASFDSLDMSVSSEDLRASVNTLTNFYNTHHSDLFKFLYNLLELTEEELEKKDKTNAQDNV